MRPVDQIIQPKWLIPMDAGPPVRQGHVVVVDQGEIIEIGPSGETAARYDAATVTVLSDHALIPGLINAHTHAGMNLLRGFADDLPLMQWLSAYIWPTEAKWVDAAFVEAGTNLACAEMIRSGTTCFNDMYFFPDTVAHCAQSAGLRACVGMIVIDFPTVWAQNADEYINKGLAVRDAVRHSPLITTAFAPHASYTVADAALDRVATLSQELECRVHIHLHETAHEVKQSGARYGMRPVERLQRLGLLGPNLMAVHMTQLLPGEIEAVAGHGVNIVHCAESNMKLASGFCPVARLVEAGVNVCIGTDGACSNNDLDMLGEMRSVSMLAKGASGDPTAFNALQTLRAATLNGAKALGLEQITGSVESGKKADLVAIDLSHCSTQPVYDPLSAIVYSASRDQVSDVWIAGERLLENGEYTRMDSDSVCQAAREWRNRIIA